MQKSRRDGGFQPHMERSGMWGSDKCVSIKFWKNDTNCKRWFTMQFYYSVVLSGLHRVTLSVNPTFRCAACGAEISAP
ncbi:hypothetical protein Barb4_00689 [Bacteroidales bacterium Barb4]|nr:hypothetical protein Barb4_00689 [Bacteroidales bacterium Barb4]